MRDPIRIVLWADLPQERRMTEADLARCGGARDPYWLRTKVARLRNPHCPAAILWWKTEDKWLPCEGQVNAGTHCALHGGIRKADLDLQRRERETVEAIDAVADRIRADIEEYASRTRGLAAAAILLGAARMLIERAEFRRRLQRADATLTGPVDLNERRYEPVDPGELIGALVADGAMTPETAHAAVRRWLSPSVPYLDEVWSRLARDPEAEALLTWEWMER